MKIDVRPLSDRILTSAPVNEAEYKQGGLIVPQSLSPLAEVRVVATGPGRCTDAGVLIEPEVKPGQWVLVNRNSGLEVERGGEKFRLVAPHEILAVVED